MKFIKSLIAHKYQAVGISLGLAASVSSFQNCSGGFQTATKTVASTANLGATSVVTAPVISLAASVPSLINSKTLSINFRVASSAALAQVTCQLDTVAAVACNSLSLNLVSLADGDHMLTIRSADINGLQANPLIVTFRVDATAPVVSFNQTPGLTTGANTASFVFSAIDNLSGVKSFQCSIDGAAYSACVSPVNLSALSSAAHSFAVMASDMAGNVSSAANYAWTVNTSLPMISISAGPKPFSNATSVSLSFSGTDAGAALTSFQCQLDAAAFATCSSPNVLTVAQGAHTFNVRGKTATGNYSSNATVNWTSDFTAPSSPAIMSNISSPTTLTSITLSFSSTDSNGIASYNCGLDGAALSACTSPVTLKVSTAAHYYQVQSIDTAGNNSAIARYDWTVNAAPPVPTPTPVITPPVVVPVVATGSGNTQILRMSNFEYQNSLSDAITYQFSRQSTSTTGSAAVISALAGSFSSLPADGVTMRLGTSQLAVSTLTADRFTAYLNIANSAAKAITGNASYLTGFAGTCATSNTAISSSTCLSTFVTNFGTLLFRKPPTNTEISELTTGITSWSDLIGRMLIHPRFLTHVEREGTKSSDGTYFKLTAYELEARLASVYWKSIPDIAGLAAASSGSVLTSAGITAEVKRLLQSQKAKDMMWKFYQEYLGAGRLPGAFDTSVDFTAFASPVALSAVNAVTFQPAVLQDARDFLEYFTWNTTGSLDDVFSSNLIFTTNATLANIYGVGARASSTAAPVADPTGQYTGILTRAIVTQQKPGTYGVANHVQRGVMILSNILGQQLGLPASFAEQQALAATVLPTDSSMVQVQKMTSPSNCMACHGSINPAGFALANFDSLGRFKSTENRYGVNSSGAATVLTSPSNVIDPTTTIFLNGNNYSVKNVATLIAAFKSSGLFYNAFAKYYFRFVFGRMESSTQDAGIISQLSSALQSGSIQNAISSMATHPDFAIARPAL